jgi:hypothetical protein
VVVERDLLAGVAHPGAEVVVVQGQQRLSGEQADPQERRHRGPLEVLAGTVGDLEVGLLQDVGGVEAALKPAVDSETDHPPQPLAMAGEKLAERPLIPLLEAAEQVVILARILIGHG